MWRVLNGCRAGTIWSKCTPQRICAVCKWERCSTRFWTKTLHCDRAANLANLCISTEFSEATIFLKKGDQDSKSTTRYRVWRANELHMSAKRHMIAFVLARWEKPAQAGSNQGLWLWHGSVLHPMGRSHFRPRLRLLALRNADRSAPI